MAKVKLSKEKLILSEKIDGFFRKKVTPFGTGAKIGCPKKFIGRTAYVVLCEEGKGKK